MSEVEDIKSRLNVVDIVSDYLPLKKSGVNFKARCPFHEEKTPSFYVNPARQIWHCFGCGMGGDIFEFVKNIESVDFRQALERLAERAGVQLTRAAYGLSSEIQDKKKVLYEINGLAGQAYHNILMNSPEAAPAREYLRKRNFSKTTLVEWQIGYAPDKWDALYEFLKKKDYEEEDIEKSGLVVRRDEGGYFDRFRDRITFPIVDLSARTVGFSARILTPKENTGKYINSPESPIYSKSKILFGLYQARNEIRKSGSAVIVEGNIDVVKSHQAGVKNALGSSGTAFTQEQLGLLARFSENLIFAFDTDVAGITAARRALESAIASGFNVRMIRLPHGLKDPDEAIDRDAQIWRDAVENSEPFLDFYFGAIFDTIDMNDAIAKDKSVNDFLSLLARVPNRIILEHYIAKIAARTMLKQETLLQRMRNLSPVPEKSFERPGSASTKTALDPSRILEQRFVGLMLVHPSMAEEVSSIVSSETFQHTEYKQIFERIRDNAQAESEQLKKIMQDMEPLVSVARFSVSEDFEPEHPEEELKALARRLTDNLFARERQRLSQAITQAERHHKMEEHKQLMQELNQLLQKKNELEKQNLK